MWCKYVKQIQIVFNKGTGQHFLWRHYAVTELMPLPCYDVFNLVALCVSSVCASVCLVISSFVLT